MRFYYLFVNNQHFSFPDVLLEQVAVGRGEFSCLLQVPVEAFSSHTLLAPISNFGAKIWILAPNSNFNDKLNVLYRRSRCTLHLSSNSLTLNSIGIFHHVTFVTKGRILAPSITFNLKNRKVQYVFHSNITFTHSASKFTFFIKISCLWAEGEKLAFLLKRR